MVVGEKEGGIGAIISVFLWPTSISLSIQGIE